MSQCENCKGYHMLQESQGNSVFDCGCACHTVTS